MQKQLKKNKIENGGKQPSAAIQELQAEMTAYVVASKFGMDTEEKSLPYIAGWTNNGQKIEDRLAVLSDVQRVSKDLITELEEELDPSLKKEQKIEKNNYEKDDGNEQATYYQSGKSDLVR
ncbi:hypothetical protein MAQA_15851 [Listeria aquatica FSL S10-1188]|uniref:Uncharacterized protein n=2 Tax=Listeria aquatica TaxID=1494960 RepID=W7AMS0_9LIST|nr:hypothetical protein MAQA_15851 [Listeria aquatica FSL S10-1188]